MRVMSRSSWLSFPICRLKKERERNSTLQNTEYLPAVEQKVAEAATGDRSCKRAQRRLGRERNHIIEGEDMLNTVFQSHCRTEEALSCAVSSLSFSHLSFFPDAVNFLFKIQMCSKVLKISDRRQKCYWTSHTSSPDVHQMTLCQKINKESVPKNEVCGRESWLSHFPFVKTRFSLFEKAGH